MEELKDVDGAVIGESTPIGDDVLRVTEEPTEEHPPNTFKNSATHGAMTATEILVDMFQTEVIRVLGERLPDVAASLNESASQARDVVIAKMILAMGGDVEVTSNVSDGEGGALGVCATFTMPDETEAAKMKAPYVSRGGLFDEHGDSQLPDLTQERHPRP